MGRVIIVGAGITGLSVARELRMRVPDVELTILESSNRAGGLVGTTVSDGYVLEWGPEAVQGSSKETLDLISRLGLDDTIIEATPESKTRYIVHRGGVVPLPMGPASILKTPLLSPAAKLRGAMEVVVGPGNGEESVAEFGARRFGPAVAPLLDAVVTGIFAGDPEALSVDAAFPQLRWLENAYGSIIKGMMKRRNAGALSAPLLTLEGGMETLVRAMARGMEIRYGARVLTIRRAGGDLEVVTEDSSETTDVVVLAGGPSMASLVEEPRVQVPTVREAPVAVVGLGYDRSVADERSRGYGFLAPGTEERFVLGVLYTSCLFPTHAPEGKVLYRAIVGGVRHPERASLDDDALVRGCRADLKALLGVEGKPEFVEVVRHPRGIPQLEVGHARVASALAALERATPGLYVEGTGCGGISTNHLIARAAELAERIAVDPRL